MEATYTDLTQTIPSKAIKTRIRSMIARVLQQHPETYVTKGIQNAITRSLQVTTIRAHWTLIDVQAKGTQTVKKLLHEECIRDALEQVGVDPRRIDPVPIVRVLSEKMRRDEEEFPTVPTPKQNLPEEVEVGADQPLESIRKLPPKGHDPKNDQNRSYLYQGFIMCLLTLPSDQQPAELMVPGMGALDDPTPGRMLFGRVHRRGVFPDFA